MDFTEKIIAYYNAETRHCFFNALPIGLILIVSSIILLSLFSSNSFLKGVAIPILIGGVFATVGSYFAGQSAKNEMPKKIELFKKDKTEFVKTESYKVDKIKKGWVGIKIFWTVPIILGLILIFVSQTRFLNGI
ncbi:MAG: hypothetical protein ACRCVT_14120, partial [Leadbetterella sp.]